MDSKFSYDMYREILSRTSLKTLDTMRCASKEIEKLSYDPDLLNMYKQRNNIVSGFLVQKERSGWEVACEFTPSPESKSLDLGFLPPDAKILTSSEQGIMVFESHPRSTEPVCYHVCKPATKQVLALPNPNTNFVTKNIAMIVVGSKPLHYKIVRLSEPKRNINFEYGQSKSYNCEIFDSRAWTWRLKDDVILPFPVYITSFQQSITAGGSVYMLLSNKEVLKFDAYSEKWTTFSSPIQTLDYPIHKIFTSRKLVKYQGKLGFACMTPSLLCWEIWLLTVDKSWEKLHVLDMKEDIAKLLLMSIYDADTWLMYESKTLIFYSFKAGGCIRKVEMTNSGYFPTRILPFRSDFEPLDLKG